MTNSLLFLLTDYQDGNIHDYTLYMLNTMYKYSSISVLWNSWLSDKKESYSAFSLLVRFYQLMMTYQ